MKIKHLDTGETREFDDYKELAKDLMSLLGMEEVEQ